MSTGKEDAGGGQDPGHSREFELPSRFKPQFPKRDIIGDSAETYHGITAVKRATTARKVFLVVPYDEPYTKTLLPASVASCWAFRLEPFVLRDDAGGPRLKRLTDAILQSQFVVADLSRSQRMNMPFELGLAMAFGKSCAILTDVKQRLERDFSDLQGLDLLEHHDIPGQLVERLVRWFHIRFDQRKWPPEPVVTLDDLRIIVEPSIRRFVVNETEKHGDPVSLARLRRSLVSFWDTADVPYLEKAAKTHHLPFDSHVAEQEIAIMRKFLGLERGPLV